MVKFFTRSEFLNLVDSAHFYNDVSHDDSHQTETTQWTHPKTGKKKRVSGELPFGWEKSVAEDGTIVYVE